MPTIPAGSKILVTGANGYIALWVLRTLLAQGYAVRAQVREESKGTHLLKLYDEYKSKGRLEVVVVGDITKEGAFDDAVKDVAGIAHMASPLHSFTDDPDDYIVPAMQGTLGVMKSALKAGGDLRRIVITSSLAAVFSTVETPPRTFTEDDWADEFVEAVRKKGKESNPNEKYRASKTLAEKSAWEFMKTNKDKISWDLAAVNPPLVFGPPLQEIASPAHLNASTGVFFRMFFEEQTQDALKATYGFVHVEDIAAAHVLALQKEEAGGERMLISGANDTWQSSRNLLRKLYPEYYSSGILPAGNASDEGEITAIYANGKGRRILGLEYKTLEETLKDTIADFKARGWLEKKYVSASS